MFADVSGFTTLADTLDPEAVTDIITTIISELSEVVGRYDGYVDKYAGDALLAFFGAPVSHEDDAERALACTLEMQQRFETMRPSFGDEAQALGLHIGVNSGHAIALVIGSEVHADYSVLGDAINVAQRLESQAPGGETYVGSLTERLARRSFALESIGSLQLKGKTEPVPAWRLVGRREATAEDFVVVGRIEERARLRSAFDRLAALMGEVVIVSGYAGVGKTSLIEAAHADAAARGTRWIDTARRVVPIGLALRADHQSPRRRWPPKVSPTAHAPARLEHLLVELGLPEHAPRSSGSFAPTWPHRDDVDPRGPALPTARGLHRTTRCARSTRSTRTHRRRHPLGRRRDDRAPRARRRAGGTHPRAADRVGPHRQRRRQPHSQRSHGRDAAHARRARRGGDAHARPPDRRLVAAGHCRVDLRHADGNPFFAVEMVRAVARGDADDRRRAPTHDRERARVAPRSTRDPMPAA